jgi:mRNA interferase ChpB
MERGDIYNVNLDPTQGREQKGQRFVLIISPRDFNNTFGTPLVCPITMGGDTARNHGFTVQLTKTKTQGFVLCNQPRIIDMKARAGRFVEKVPQDIIDEVLAKVSTLIN